MYRILVIDDEDEVRAGVRRRLERAGFEVTTAETANEGIELIKKEEPFDVIVTDMSIEDPEAGLRILTAAFTVDLLAEVIVMTAYGNVANAVECMRRGAYDYIEKNQPGVDTYEILIMKIEQAMEQRRHDMRAVQRWERAARAQEKRLAEREA
ncbi:MAG TPA: response regulator [Fimbriimonadaceae bacterium]|nr:response regulator [Fimbriimonadaceae bacterium]HRJ95889.1 response regulator [Fimbriimonadaceae bacterium]